MPARQPDQTLERAAFARRGRSAAAATLSVELAETLPATTHLSDQVVDQGWLERHLRNHLLDRLASDGDRRGRSLPADARPAPREERFLEADDLALQAADTRELRKHRPNRLGFELAPLGQDDDVVGRGFAPTQPVADFQEGGDRHRNPGERAAQRDLADLDPSTDLDFLSRSQQRDLTDFLQVETDGILTLGREPSIGFLGNRLRGLFHLILHLDGDLSILSRIDRGRRGGLKSVRRSFSKCHRVTSLYTDSCWFRCAICAWRFTSGQILARSRVSSL